MTACPLLRACLSVSLSVCDFMSVAASRHHIAATRTPSTLLRALLPFPTSTSRVCARYAGHFVRVYDAPKRPFSPDAPPPFPTYTLTDDDRAQAAKWASGA